jgi:hypothetical protein
MSVPDRTSEDRAARTYVLVVICEAAVITGLWILQRVFA